MMKIKAAEFFNRNYDGPKYRVLAVSCVGSLAFALILGIANEASEIVADAGMWVEIGLLGVFLSLCVVSLICKRYTLNRTTVFAQKIVRRVRVRLIDKLRHTELQFVEQKQKGEIYARIIQDTELLSHALPNLISALEAALSAIAVLIYMAVISITGFFLALTSLVAMNVIFLKKYVKIKDTLRLARLKEGDFSDALNGVLSGFKEIKVNTRKNNALFADIEILAKRSEKLKAEAEVNHDKNVVMAVFMSQVVLGIIVFVVPQYSEAYGDVTTELVASVLFLFGLIGMAMGGIYTITRANVAVESLEKLEADITAFGTHADTETRDIPDGFREISLSAIAFNYTDAEGENVFTAGPVDLTIKRGEVLFIVGGNGSGKSTLLKLLTGLYYPATGGHIRLDGRALNRRTYQGYRELFSVIFTDFHLFKKLYGVVDADAQRVHELLRTMELHTKTDYVDGRYTKTDLSTGQRKRLAYITALLGDKSVYVFDEWAADQDPTFRRHFYNQFLQDLRAMGKTIIAVTHDDRYFDKADRIIKMEEGTVVAESHPPGNAADCI